MRGGVERRLREVSRRYEGLIEGLPEPLKGLGRELSARLSHGFGSPVEYFGAEEFHPLLRFPLWLEDKYVSDGLLTGGEGYGTEAASASLFGYLYIRIQDNVLDEPEGFDSAYLLIGNEFVREFFAAYHRLFGSRSPFWGYFRDYWLGTANNTLWERRECAGRPGETGAEGIARAGGKLDGAKISMAALCMLAGREADVARYGPVIDRLNIASQLHNDAVSFVKDLRHDYFTCVVADSVGGGEAAAGREEIFRKASIKALTTNCLEEWLGFAGAFNSESLSLIGKGELPGLEAHVKAKNAHLAALKKEITKLKAEILSI